MKSKETLFLGLNIQKRILQDSVDIGPFIRIFLQNFFDELDSDLRHVLGILEIDFHYFFHSFLSTNVVKRSLSSNKFVGQHPNAPNIHAVVITVPVNDLRTDVI